MWLVVLSIAKVGRGGERYYLEAVAAGVEDHRRAGQEPDGVWLGGAARQLGLRGSVAGADLGAALGGADPTSGEVLNDAQQRVRVAGFDLVFAAPKSVSLCFALGDPRPAAQVRAAHEASVAAALGYLEREAVTARRGSGAGRYNIAVDGVLAAAFLHRTSRAPDPHLHSHVLVANVVRGSDGRWSAFDARGLYAHARTAGFLYQAHLRHELSRWVGLEWGATRSGMADVDGIDRSVIRTFSRRSRQIEARMADEGRSGPRAARVAQLATRATKDLGTSFETLTADWRARACDAGLGRAELAAAMHGARREPPAKGPAFTDAWVRSLVGPEGLTASASTFSRPEVIRACCSALREGAQVETVELLADAVLGSDLVRPVARRERRWTTPEVLEAERAVVESALRRGEAEVGVVEPAALESALSDRPQLAQAQAAGVREVLRSGAGVVVATGARWAGSTDALDAAREAWQCSGLRVEAGASSSEQAADLEAVTGIETTPAADIVPRLEGRAGPALAPDVLVVHGAGRLTARTARTMLDAAERAGTKVVLLDEIRQLRSVEGGVFRRLGESLGSICLDAPRSTAVAERAFGDGWVEVVERGAGDGAVVVGSSAPTVRRQLVADWWADRRAGRDSAMVAMSGGEVEALNAGARAELTAAGQLAGSMTVGRREMAVGDRVLVGRSGRAAGLSTGTRATVTGLDAERGVLDLRTDQGRTLSIGASTAVDVELRHAYAMSARQARRVRPERALVLGDGRLACGLAGEDRRYVVDGVGATGRTSRGWRVAPELVAPTGSALDQLGRRLANLDHRLARAVPSDPTAALARLDQEQARADERLIAARSARSAGIHRMDELAKRRWRGGRAARDEARDVRRELTFRDAEVRRWEDRGAILGDRRRELESQSAGRSARLTAQQSDRTSREILVEAVARRERVLVRAAEVSPPAHVVAELGSRPTGVADRAAWRQAVLAVESYRERWGVTDRHRALGHRPTSSWQDLQWASAARQLDGAQRRLGPELAIERAVERSPERILDHAL